MSKEYERKRIAMVKKRDREFFCGYYSVDKLTKVIFSTDLDTIVLYQKDGKLKFTTDTERGREVAKELISFTIPLTIVHSDPKGEATDGLEEYSAKKETVYDIMSTKNATSGWLEDILSTDGKCTVTWEGIKDGKVIKGKA